MNHFITTRRVALFVFAVLAIAISMLWIDAPLAALFGDRFHFAIVETVLGGVVLVGAELLVLAGLLLAARASGRIGGVSRTLMFACAASILAYGGNFLLKILFGRPVPLTTHDTDGPVFHFLQGDNHSSFPSGHMALLGAFAGTLWQSWPAARPCLALLLCLAGAGVVAGNWHYVSDTIAGAVLGLSAGMAASWLKMARVPVFGTATDRNAAR